MVGAQRIPYGRNLGFLDRIITTPLLIELRFEIIMLQPLYHS
jgi:hypothetical protein